jgi:hypothetical protein
MAEGDQVRDESSDFGRDGARGRASEVRQSTRELEEGSVWPEEVHGGRNRAEGPPGLRKKRGRRRRCEASRDDSSRQEVEEVEGRRLVVAAQLGAEGGDDTD